MSVGTATILRSVGAALSGAALVAALAGCGAASGGAASGGAAAGGTPAPGSSGTHSNTHRSSGSTAAAGGYGSLPTFLPTPTIRPDSVLDASESHLALTTQGDGVRVHLPSGSALVRVTGPAVPGEGLPFQPEFTTCTFDVTVTGLSGSVPIDPKRFDVLDHLGHRSTLFVVPDGPRPPRQVAAGRTVDFQLRGGVRTGEGLVRWTPDGHTLVAEWDFVVEID